MHNDKIIYRRVRKSEQSQLEELCKEDSVWPKYYHDHNKWLAKAFHELIRSENRVVFGAFESQYDENGTSYSKLIACVFLKRSHFENKIELKNFIFPVSNDYSDLPRILIEKSIRFCEIRNIEKIEIEIPQDEHHIVSIFLLLNFRIVSIRDRVNPNKLVCILEKTVGDFYYGDPFDNLELANWILKQYLPTKVISQESDFGLVKISFEAKPISKAFGNENEIGKHMRLSGVMWILEHDETDTVDNDLARIVEKSKSSTLKLILADFLNDENKKILNENNFIYFEYSDAKVIAGGKQSSLNIPFGLDEIGGVLTVLEYDKLLERSQHATTTYYLFSGISEGLAIPEKEEQDAIMLFDESYIDPEAKILAVYCPNWKINGSGIVGYFEILDLEKKRFDLLLKDEISFDSSLTKDDLISYSLYSEDKKVAILQCGTFHLFDKRLSLSNGSWTSSSEVKDYLKLEVDHNGNNSAYLDISSCLNLIKQKTISPMILTTIATVIAAIADTISVGKFAKQITEWKSNLNEKGTESEKEIESSNLKVLIGSYEQKLKGLAQELAEANNAEFASDLDKKRHCKMLAHAGLETMKVLKPFKNYIPNYDQIVEFFESVISN